MNNVRESIIRATKVFVFSSLFVTGFELADQKLLVLAGFDISLAIPFILLFMCLSYSSFDEEPEGKKEDHEEQEENELLSDEKEVLAYTDYVPPPKESISTNQIDYVEPPSDHTNEAIDSLEIEEYEPFMGIKMDFDEPPVSPPEDIPTNY